MKINTLWTVAILSLSVTIFGCDAFKQKTNDGADDEMVEGVSDVEDDPVSLPHATASPAITKYNSIFGGENIYRYIAKEDPAGSVMLPRFYTINRSDFQNLLETHLTNEYFYASLAVTETDYDAEGTASGKAYLSDLIFHSTRPYATGYLRDKGANDNFFDDAQPCPVDCNPGTGANPGSELSLAVANTRVRRYNEMYGEEKLYLTAHDGGEEQVSVARYYRVNRADFQDVLNSTSSEYIFASLAAFVDEGNNYKTDLIFHDTNPGPQGGIASSEKKFYDFMLPCPEHCDTTSSSSD